MPHFTPINTGPCQFYLCSIDTRRCTRDLPSYQSTNPGKLREVTMDTVQNLDLSKRNAVAKKEKEAFQKRKLPPHSQVFDSLDKSSSKRPKIGKRNINESSEAKTVAQRSPTALSAATLSKLNAFRFQVPLHPQEIPKEHAQRFSFSNIVQHTEKHEELSLNSDTSSVAASGVEKASYAGEYTEFAQLPKNPEQVKSGDRFESPDQGEQNGHFVWHDMDDLDESVFEQFIAEDEADGDQAPPLAQPQTACFTTDPITTPTKSSLMPPSELPAPPTLPARSTDVLSHQKSMVSPSAPMSPFVRAGTKVPTFLSSSIPNFSSTGRIPTCFRLAELLRHISSINPLKPDGRLAIAPIELFATVTASSRNRNSTAQTFTFADLFFPQRPPYIEGTYMHYAESELFDDDSRPFLESRRSGNGILARAMVRPRIVASSRDTRGSPGVGMCRTMELQILSIWACTWDDVQYTKGIVMPEPEISKEVTSGKSAKFIPLQPTGVNVSSQECAREEAL